MLDIEIPRFTYLIKDKLNAPPNPEESQRNYLIVKDEVFTKQEEGFENISHQVNKNYKKLVCIKTPYDEVVKVESDESNNDEAVVISKKMYNNLKNI